ncbi:MAG TPA: response regulator transcription factor [Actinomycetota bacterium]|nr:response regulator transcription factor [Actinomycetota bacterium]
MIAGETRVLVVDDHPAYAQGLRALLELHSSSLHVEAASNPDDALEIAARAAPDVMLVDVRMPHIGGIELAGRLRALAPSTRVLMLTVSEDADDVRTSFAAGAVGYLSKDLDPAQVAAAVSLSLAGAVVLSKVAFDALTGASVDDPRLSPDELLLLELAADGAPLDRIAKRLVVSRATATRMLVRLQDRFGLSNRDQLVAHAARRGWV